MNSESLLPLLLLGLCLVPVLYPYDPTALSDAHSPESRERREQEQAIRLRTELIELRAVVTDKRGEAVVGLGREDFEVLENGKAQEVSFFSMVRMGVRGEEGVAGERGKPAGGERASAEVGGRPGEAPGRTVVLFIDTLHLSAQSLMRAKAALRSFIDQRLTDQDLTAIVTSVGSLGVVEQFTRDRRVLRYAVDRLTPRPSGRATLFTPYLAALVDRGVGDAFDVAVAIYAAEEHMDPSDPGIRQMVRARARQILTEATYLRRSAMITLREVVERMSGLPGQRLIVGVSDGFTLLDSGGSMDSSDLQSVTSRAVRSGVVIYTIDAKGLQPPVMFDAALGAMPLDPRVASYSAAGERDLENGLNALARDTGGDAFFNTNDSAGAMAKALDDNRLYYMLAYYPAGEESEKKYRKITIRVRNHPEYAVRAQRGYLPSELAKKAEAAASRSPQQRFVDAILAPLPATAIGVTATADFIESTEDAAQVSLLIHVDGSTLTYQMENGRHRFETEVLTMTYNSDGKRVDLKAETIRGTLSPERWALARENGLQYRRRLSLKQGLYQIRVGVREPGSERMGTAATWIETTDLSKGRLAMSSLILSDAVPDPTTPRAEMNEPLLQSKVVQGIRYYRAGQPVIYFLRLYNALAPNQTEPDAEMQVELLRDEKPVITIPWQPASSRVIGRDAKGLILGGQLSMPKIPAGIYELRLSIRNGRTRRPVHRTASFGVEP
ncbi:MAG: VWA domain-containing protein [Blastocatellia bacterium]